MYRLYGTQQIDNQGRIPSTTDRFTIRAVGPGTHVFEIGSCLGLSLDRGEGTAYRQDSV